MIKWRPSWTSHFNSLQDQYHPLQYWLEYKARYRLWSWKKWLVQPSSLASIEEASESEVVKSFHVSDELNYFRILPFNFSWVINPPTYFLEKVLILSLPFEAQKWLQYLWRFPLPIFQRAGLIYLDNTKMGMQLPQCWIKNQTAKSREGKFDRLKLLHEKGQLKYTEIL